MVNTEENTVQPETSAAAAPPPPPQVKHEWYQTESQVTVSILAKNMKESDVTVTATENQLVVKTNSEEVTPKLNFTFNLCHPIQADQLVVKCLSSKIEIKLKKCEAIQWKALELTAAELAKKLSGEQKPEYPSSSRKPKNWDKIEADIKAEEKDEKLEGDAALNKLFQQVYSNGSDETRRAMNKSFMESGGTVLSTNWGEVGAKKLDVKPPDGMEWKKWDQ